MALDRREEIAPIAWRTEYRDIYKGKDTGWHFVYHSTKPNPAPLTRDGCGHRNVTPLYASPAEPSPSPAMEEIERRRADANWNEADRLRGILDLHGISY